MALPCQLMPAGLWPLPCAFLGLLLLPAQAPIYGFTTSSCLTSWADNSTQPGPGREAFQRVPMGGGGQEQRVREEANGAFGQPG